MTRFLLIIDSELKFELFGFDRKQKRYRKDGKDGFMTFSFYFDKCTPLREFKETIKLYNSEFTLSINGELEHYSTLKKFAFIDLDKNKMVITI